MMVIGGWGTSSVEMIGFDNCSVPDLPETRYGHGSFMTSWGSLAVCGGWWDGKPASSDCLVLNTTTRQWERGILGGRLGGHVRGVVTLDVGTYMVHSLSSSFLPSGKFEWIAGPNPPQSVQCVTGISADSFLIFGGTTVRQFDSRTSEPISDQGWVPENVWPDLLVERILPGCATLGDLCFVAGGMNSQNEALKSVEIIALSSKSLGKTNDMLKPRSHFSLVVLGRALLAIGGNNNETSMEVWEGLEEPWRLASQSLTKSRKFFSALPVDDRVCLEEPLPPHFCPTLDGGTCVFPFRNGTKKSFVITLYLFHQDLKPTALVLKTGTTNIGVQLQQMNGHNVTHKNAL